MRWNECTVRRLISMLLLLLVGLPLTTPLFALGATARTGVPACCRRSGQHHCAMGAEESGRADRQGAMHAPAGPLDVFTVSHAGALYAAVVSHPASVTQSECKWRMARDRSRQKRGPPFA